MLSLLLQLIDSPYLYQPFTNKDMPLSIYHIILQLLLSVLKASLKPEKLKRLRDKIRKGKRELDASDNNSDDADADDLVCNELHNKSAAVIEFYHLMTRFFNFCCFRYPEC